NERNGPEPRILHPGAAQGKAVHLRHQHVGDDGIWPVAPCGGQRLQTVAGNRHPVAVGLEQHLEESAVLLVVLDDQNVSHEMPSRYNFDAYRTEPRARGSSGRSLTPPGFDLWPIAH